MRIVLIVLVLANINLFAAYENYKDPGESEKATCLGNCCTVFKDANPGTRDPEELTRVKYHCKLVTILYTRECQITCVMYNEETNTNSSVSLPVEGKLKKQGSGQRCVFQGEKFEGGDNVCNGDSDIIDEYCYYVITEDPCNEFSDDDMEAIRSQYFPGHEYSVSIQCFETSICKNNYSGN